ncbi:MAG: hypothetical protein H7X86_05380 [Gorillibacterium sp.]|nr:hypothetical protein [Gorillibacterium sp.]
MNLQDALFNWLQIKLITEARPDDGAAVETLAFFEEILHVDHGLEQVELAEIDANMVHIRYTVEGITKQHKFNRELAGKLLADIKSAPKNDH